MSTIHFYIILKRRVADHRGQSVFEYHTFLHHSQTDKGNEGRRKMFEYHTFLHHSQTSNLKMNCFHLHKTGTQTSDGY